MKRKSIVIFLAALSLTSYAKSIEVNLDDVVNTAKEKDKEIKQAEVTVENYELQKKQAFKSGLPELKYMGSTMKSESLDSEAVNKYYLELSQTVFDGFQTANAIKNADKYVEMGNLSLENKKNEIGLEAMEYYFTLDKYKKELQILEKSRAILESNYEKTNQKYQLELITKSEVLEISYSLIELDTEIIKMNNNIETTKMKIKNLLGISTDEELKADEIEIKELNIDEINVKTDVENAIENSLTMKIQKLNTELNEANEATSKADFMPTVNLAFDYGNISSVIGDVSEAFKSENMSWSIGVNISGTLFNWGKTMDAYNEAKNDTKIAQYDEAIKKDEIELNIKSQYLELIRLKKLEAANEKALESAKENYVLQEKSYENSLINSTDYLQAENDMREAELNLVEARLDLYLAYEQYMNLLK